MPQKFTPEKREDNGSYVSANLSDKQFNQLFNKIEKAQKQARKNAKRTLKPSTLTRPTDKALKALGEKAKGMRFTKADLERFDKARKAHVQKYDKKTAGVPYSFLVKSSRKIDVDRANNRVDDGSGINKATLLGLKGNIALIRVKASSISKHQEHKVSVRFEEWEDMMQMPPDGDYVKGTKAACAGRISFDCDCGRHQYWYRYVATMGNFQIKPPSEFAFPKIRNPELIGVACKHVLKATAMLQSPAWWRVLAKQMEKQADRVGFGSTRTHFLTKDEKKAASKNRKGKTDQSKAAQEYKRYQKAQVAVAKVIKEKGSDAAKVRQQARVLRKKNKELNAMNDMIRVGLQNFTDSYAVQGKSKGEAIRDYAKMMNVSESKLKRMMK